jgi:hypothetical protein
VWEAADHEAGGKLLIMSRMYCWCKGHGIGWRNVDDIRDIIIVGILFFPVILSILHNSIY